MVNRAYLLGVCLYSGLIGCAHIDFGADGLRYFEPVPYLMVTTAPDCAITAQPVVLPGKAKYMRFVSGYGSEALSATLSTGMISTVGQTVDTKGAETLTAVAALKAATAAVAPSVSPHMLPPPPAPAGQAGPLCSAGVSLYSLNEAGAPTINGVATFQFVVTPVK